MNDQAVRIRDMPHEDLRRMLRTIGPEIGQLAARGDRFAAKVIARYNYAFEHPQDKQANWEMRIAFEDYMNRDLRDAEKYELGSRYGHQLEEVQNGPRIFMPASEIKQ